MINGHDYIIYSLSFGGNKMLIIFYKILFLLLLATLVYFNISVPFNYAIFVNIYPYLLGFTALLTVFFLILQFVQNNFIIKTIYVVMTLFLVFFIFTFLQIWKTTKIINDYELKDKNIKMTSALYNQAFFIYDDKAMFDEMIEEISKAKSHIHIEFFILRNDNIGQKFKELLIKKAKEGVDVRVIYDGLGSLSLKKSYIKELQDKGVEIKPYDSIFQSIIKGKLNNRNHRKIVIVDGIVGFIGGINIGDEYLSRDDSIGNWKDVLVKIKGQVANDIQRVFLYDWHYVSGEKLIDNKYLPKWKVEKTLPIQIVVGKYGTKNNEISNAYLSMITSSKDEIYIVTPYLVPGNSILEAIKSATLRGVNVKIIIPKNPDHFLVGWVNASFFNELLNSKVKIYLYEDGFLHSKVFVIDDKIVSVGSANLNTRSQYLDYEMNAILYDKNQSELMIKELRKNIETSTEITLEDYNKRSLIQRFKEKIGVFMRPLV